MVYSRVSFSNLLRCEFKRDDLAGLYRKWQVVLFDAYLILYRKVEEWIILNQLDTYEMLGPRYTLQESPATERNYKKSRPKR
jgi:hypothetical protein